MATAWNLDGFALNKHFIINYLLFSAYSKIDQYLEVCNVRKLIEIN